MAGTIAFRVGHLLDQARNRLRFRAGMKPLLTGVLCIGFILFEVTPVHAQSTSAGGGAKSKFAHNARIESVYDSATDQTTVMMDWYSVFRGLPKQYDPEQDNRLDIKAVFGYPGRVLSSTPEAVEFGIRVGNQGGPQFKQKETPELNAVVDGETISLGKALLVRGYTQLKIPGTGQISFALLSVRFTYQGLLRIVRAHKVAMRIGKLEFDLREINLEALRDLASRMVPN